MYYSGIIIQFIAGITDFVIAAFALWAFVMLFKVKNKKKSSHFFLMHFILMTISTIIAGLAGHIFVYKLIPVWKLPGWIISMVAVIYLERAVITQSNEVLNAKWIKNLLAFNVIVLCFFGFLTITTLDFKYVQYHACYGLLGIVLGLGVIQWKNGHFKKNLFLGLACCVFAAIVFKLKLGFGIWFNCIAVSHILLAFSTYFFYRLSRE
jgi:hypothetical protein